MSFQKLYVFLLKRFPGVMFALVGDVFTNGIDVGFGNGERPITGLPGKIQELRSLRLDPFGRRLLDILDGPTDRDGSGQVEEQMGMVFDGIDEHGSAAKVFQHGGHVAVQRDANDIGDDALSVLGAEDNVNMKTGEGLRHGFGRPFRAWLDLYSDPGRCPGLASSAPLALVLDGP